jgi:CRISPR-associated protein Csd1
MILESLVSYYEALAERGEIDRIGWGKVSVSYGLRLEADGTLSGVIPLKMPVIAAQSGKKVLTPQVMTLPVQVKKTSGIISNFLCENAAYFLGLDTRGKPERAVQCFEAAGALHRALLSDVPTPAAQAVCRYFETWRPQHAAEDPVLEPVLREIRKGANLIFCFGQSYVHDDPEIRQAWQRYYMRKGNAPLARCLVTGEIAPIARLHPAIKGIRNGQAMGNSLVSFNANASESYGQEQGLNAPTGEYAAFAYGAALNHLLSDTSRVIYIGSASVVCWSVDGETAYQDVFITFLTGKNKMPGFHLDALLKKLAAGQMGEWGGTLLNPDMIFYVLELVPSAARISVRGFLRNTVGAFAKNILAHYERLEIARSPQNNREKLWIWNLLYETTNRNLRDKTLVAHLVSDTVSAVLMGQPYPATLFAAVQFRMRADRRVTRGRAAIVKAYLLRNTAHAADYQDYKEVLCVALNEESNYVPYVLGRLFSVLETIQMTADPDVNTSFRVKYLTTACIAPDLVFPLMLNLAQTYLEKIADANPAEQVDLSNQISELINRLNAAYPPHLNVHEQGVFQIGYYHQTAYTREEKAKQEERHGTDQKPA